MVEPGLPLGLVGAGGSAVTLGVPAEDRWMGGDRSTAALEVLMERDGSDAAPRELMEWGGPIAVPHEPIEGSGPIAAPHEPMEGSGPIAAPHEPMEGSGPIAVPHEPMEGSGPVAAPHEPTKGSSPVASPLETREMSPLPQSRGFLQWGHPLGPAPKKSLAHQAGWMALPDVAPISGRSSADAVASLANLAAPMVVPAPLVVAEWVASSMVGVAPLAEGLVSPMGVAAIASSQEQPDVAMVASEVAAQSVPPVAQETTLDMGQAEEEVVGGSPTLTRLARSDIATVASEGAA
ncbi:uncharacterized protein [Miscanthus floridulus]|uniref:uncharacterized protein n=1 Tax=Miscanthus floridulus TaxID=154761 RepID=UPI0034591063